ncbi:MAG TPA: hypothetical protein VIJ95_11530 [Hanamia sp.]
MNPEFNRLDFFTKSELTLPVLKFRNENEKFKKKVMALPRQERDNFLYKFYHAFILHEGKENQEELITKALARINY